MVLAVVGVHRTEEMLCEPLSAVDPFLPASVVVVGWISLIHVVTIL